MYNRSQRLRNMMPQSFNKVREGVPALHTLVDMPWRTTNEVRRLLALPYTRLAFAVHGVPWGRRWRIFGTPIIQRHLGSRIVLGDGLSLRSWPCSNPLAPNHRCVLATRTQRSVIRFGENCGLTGAVIVAADRVELGDRVTVGANSTITDTDFHPLDPKERRRDFNAGRHKPVFIGDDVFIGMNSIVLKGVTIGKGAVVGAGSVVSHDVPAGATVAGNPAQIIRAPTA